MALLTPFIQFIDEFLILRIVNKGSQIDTETLRQMLQKMKRTDLVPFVWWVGDAVAEIEECGLQDG